jgi:hypothetical protein
VFGSATVKINNQIVEYDPVPADLSAEPELLDPSNPSSYNYWISNISSGLIKRLTGLVVRGIYRNELETAYMLLELPKDALSLAIMVRDGKRSGGTLVYSQPQMDYDSCSCTNYPCL